MNGLRLQADPATYRLTLTARSNGRGSDASPRAGWLLPEALPPGLASRGVVVVNMRTGARRVLSATRVCRDAVAARWSRDGPHG